MIFKIAWRNIWRSPLRSAVLLFSIVIGIWAGIFIVGFTNGLNQARVSNTINSTISHVQIHNPEFEKDEKVQFVLPDVEAIEATLDTMTLVKAYSLRTVFNGMVSSAITARGAKMMGVDPEVERTVSTIPGNVMEGNWFAEDKKNSIVIGSRLADILKVKVGNKIRLTFQDADNTITNAAFRVRGLYKTTNSKMDEMLVYMRNKDMQRYLGGARVHEIAIICTQFDQSDALENQLMEYFPDLSVKSWKKLAPELAFADEVMAQMIALIMAIIMLALMFGIINNMLMAILERRHELGMLQAVGMNKRKVFSMVVIETVFIGLAGGPIGMLLGWLTTVYFMAKGIDLSIIGEGLESFGMSTTVRPAMQASFYVTISVMVVFMSLIASIFPAYKALKLNPVEAIRAL